MPFPDHKQQPYNFDVKFQGNSESYDQHGFFGTKFRGNQNFLITMGGFYNERENSGADWPVLILHSFLVISGTANLQLFMVKKRFTWQ